MFSATTAGKVFLGLLATSVLTVFTACVAGFLVAVRELVRACREATIASRAITQCTENINVACAALKETLTKADQLIDDVENLGTTTASVLETATREAGVLQRRLSDLPNTASRTLMEAITRQYAASNDDNNNEDNDAPGGEARGSTGGGLEEGGGATGGGQKQGLGGGGLGPGVWAGDVRIEIGAEIEGGRVGSKWLGGAPGCNFTFNRSNRFRTGEYCAVPRTNQTYTWGVIELNDEDYSIDEGPEDEIGVACEWPPRDPDEKMKLVVSGGDYAVDGQPAEGGGDKSASLFGGFFERQIAAAAAAAGPERADKMEGWLRTITGLTEMEEREYKVGEVHSHQLF